jgi:hypothetical protein
MSLRSRRSKRQELRLALSVLATILLLLAGLFFQEETAAVYRTLAGWLGWLDARV